MKVGGGLGFGHLPFAAATIGQLLRFGIATAIVSQRWLMISHISFAVNELRDDSGL
jgi:hypothetical protein